MVEMLQFALRKQGQTPNWKNGLLMSDCGSSVSWLSFVDGIFPCLRPRNKNLLLQHGKPKIAYGLEWLAVQGIGLHDVHAFMLLSEDNALLRGLEIGRAHV